MKKKILVLLGSTKQHSVNQKIVNYIAQKTETFFELEIFPIETLPFFNPDVESEALLPKSVRDFREKIEMADGILISTPEYVFSIPGILKNALEWTVSTVLFDKKPTAIITAASSGIAADQSIQLIMKTIGADIADKCAVLISSPKSKINDLGEVTDIKTAEILSDLIQQFKQKIA
jgi:chromate reductase, NAD(P)H dehydrogenase (quinone)